MVRIVRPIVTRPGRLAAAALLALGLVGAGSASAVAPDQTPLPVATVAVGTLGQGASPGIPSCNVPPTALVDTTFVVTLSEPSVDPVDVPLTWGGTAVPGTDYANHPVSVTVPAGATSATIATGMAQSAEGTTIVLTIAAGSGYTVGTPSTATAEIALVVVPAILCVPLAPPPESPPEVAPEFTG